MRGFILSAALVFCLTAEAAQHRLRVYPNPSITILSIAEGPDGFLWLAATDGLYRFDGFHYHKMTSYPFSSARLVAFTGDGSLWSGDYEGLARLRNNRFEIVSREEVANVAAYPDQLFVSFRDLTRIGLDGSLRHLGRRTRRDLTIDPSGKLWSVCPAPARACWIDPRQPDAINAIELPGDEFQEVAFDAKGRMWAADSEQAALIEDGRRALKLQRRRTHETSRPGPLLTGRNGQLWFLGESIRGLSSGIEFRDRAEHDRFAPISGFEDPRGHLWLASLGQGLVEWIPEPKWSRWFPEDLAGEPTVTVARSQDGALILATQKNLYRLNAAGDQWTPLTNQDYRYEGLLPLKTGGFLASIRPLGVARLSAEGRVIERLKDLSPEKQEYRKIAQDGQGRYWVGAKRALLRIEGQAGSLHLRREKLPDIGPDDFENAVDFEVDAAGRLWVGYFAGIAWLDDQGRWRKLVTDQPVTLVRSFTLAGDDIWVAHRRSGSFSRLHRTGEQWRVTLFSANAGYGPVDTEFLKRDSRGWIWRGSTNGVYISDGRQVTPNEWIHLHPGNGLATMDNTLYGFLEDLDGSVWIAGEEGVTHLRPDASWFDAPRSAPPPRITRVEADGRVFLFPTEAPAALPSATKILRIDVGSLHAPPFRDYPLRYRLLPLSQDWLLSRDGTLEFRNLSEQAYTLEVGYTGNGPSAIASYPLRIGSDPPALSWLRLIGFMVAAGALIPIVHRAPWFDRTKFRIEKAIFLLRRRYTRRRYSSSSGGSSAANDYSGATLVGRYRLSGILSRGGFSVVYEACDLLEGNARRAVKVLNRSSGQESWMRDRFAHEVAALRSVQHPGVVRILDSWISPAGEPCLAMPFLDGRTLRAALKPGPFGRGRAARMITQIGAALAEVHERGIIHRDLKPENLILLSPGTALEQPVIIDFGTAGLRSAENELAATTLMSGSFHYMAPERLTGRYSPASDIFSLGVIILEMLSGKRLADLSAMFSDPSFRGELEKALQVSLDADTAKAVAARLSGAYDPEPRRRPTAVKPWSEELAEALDQT